MVICKHCQAELPESIRFCERCGNAVDEETYTPIVVDFPTALLPATVQPDQLQQNMQSAHAAGGAGSEQHGLHQQPQIQHGAHHQTQAVHDVHGVHQQSQAAHGLHQQPQIQHGVHHQPQAVHGVHQQPQAMHGAGHLRGAQGCRPSCMTMIVTTAVIITAVTASLLLLFPYILPGGAQPTSPGGKPTLNMPTSVSPGEIITVQGSHFSSGLHVLITVDTQQKAREDEPASLSPADLLGPLQVLTQQLPQQGTPLTVKNDGTFTAAVQADPSWPAGSQHNLYISRQDGSLIMRQQFTIKAGNPALASCSVSTSSDTITLGPVAAGQNAPTSKPFQLCTQGVGEVDWSSSWDTTQAPWLLLVQSGHVQAPQMQPLQLSASAASLKVGTYTTTITFSSQHSTSKITLNVTLLVQDQKELPCLAVNTSQLNFTANAQGSNPAAQGVMITNNCAAGSWSATLDQSWLGLSASSGNIDAKSNINLSVQASIANLAAGTYTGQVTLDPGTVMVTVILRIQPIPCISVQGSPLNISVMEGNTSANTPARVSFSNGASCGAGTWTARSDVSWITLNTSSGSLNAGATATIAVNINENAVGTGKFSGHITFSPGSGSSVMTINLTIYRRLCITASPTSLSFSAYVGRPPSIASRTFIVTTSCNTGNVSISNITTDDRAKWLNATGGGSLSTGGRLALTVTVSNPSLGAGNYTGHVYITITGSDGGTTSIRVDVNYSVSYQIG
jgi:BACON domain-containing protein